MTNYIEPHIEIGEPGQPITLYEGQLEVHLGKQTNLIENSSIVFVFLPQPRIEFHFTGADTLVMKLLFGQENNFQIKLPQHNIFINAIAISKSTSNAKIIALQQRKIGWSSTIKLSDIKFDLPNFFQILSLIELNSQQWKITIKSLKNITDIKNYLRYSHNYAVTHIGVIENTQSNTFDLEATDDVIDSIYYFLSFCRGFWLAPILMYGFDAKSNKIWESLEHNVDRWESTRSWLPLTESNSIENAFTGFCNKWQDNK